MKHVGQMSLKYSRLREVQMQQSQYVIMQKIGDINLNYCQKHFQVYCTKFVLVRNYISTCE